MSYYPPYRSSSNNIKVELDIDLSNYATKDDVKKVEDKVDENNGILDWNPKNIYGPSNKNMLNGVQNKFATPKIKNDGKGLHVFLVVTILYKIL